jgi:putative glutathione S-transferase
MQSNLEDNEEITEADWRLFPTLVRLDIDYFTHSRCSIQRLTGNPYLCSYARELYSWYGIAQTSRLTPYVGH